MPPGQLSTHGPQRQQARGAAEWPPGRPAARTGAGQQGWDFEGQPWGGGLVA